MPWPFTSVTTVLTQIEEMCLLNVKICELMKSPNAHFIVPQSSLLNFTEVCELMKSSNAHFIVPQRSLLNFTKICEIIES